MISGAAAKVSGEHEVVNGTVDNEFAIYQLTKHFPNSK